MPQADDVKPGSSPEANTQVSQPAPSSASADSQSASTDVQQTASPEGDKGSEGEKKTESLRDRVVRASQETRGVKPEVEAQADTQDAGEESEESPDSDSGELKLEDFANEPFHKHPRFRKLLEDHNKYRGLAQQYAQGAQEFAKYQHFVQNDLGLSEKEFTGLLALGYMSKHDPSGLYAILKPMLDELAVQVGEALPAELQARVDSGDLDLESAKEIAKLAAGKTLAEQKAKQTVQSVEQTREQQLQRQVEQVVETVRVGLNTLEAQWQKFDPDYSRKATYVRNALKVAFSEKPPASADEAVRRAKTIKAQADKEFGSRPKPTIKTPVAGGVQSSTAVPAKPGSLKEAIINASRTARGAA